MTKEQTIAGIARRELRIATLERRFRDALDFHSVGVLSVKDALTEAFDSGWANAWLAGVSRRDGPEGPPSEPSEPPLPMVSYHRHDGDGMTFHAVLFTDRGPDGGRKLAILFDESTHVAVLDLDLLAAGNIAFGSNSWRGDLYAAPLRAMIAQHHRTAHP